MKNRGKRGEHREWVNRIVGSAIVDAGELLDNPRNWRTHPPKQREALQRVLDQVGWVDEVIVNKRTGFVVNGHLRVELARERGDKVPVQYIDVSEEEEAAILATFDPIAALARADSEMLASLATEVESAYPMLETLLSEILKREKVGPTKERPVQHGIEEKFIVLVECASEEQQVELLDRLSGEGYLCRALIS